MWGKVHMVCEIEAALDFFGKSSPPWLKEKAYRNCELLHSLNDALIWFVNRPELAAVRYDAAVHIIYTIGEKEFKLSTGSEFVSALVKAYNNHDNKNWSGLQWKNLKKATNRFIDRRTGPKPALRKIKVK